MKRQSKIRFPLVLRIPAQCYMNGARIDAKVRRWGQKTVRMPSDDLLAVFFLSFFATADRNIIPAELALQG